MRLKDKIAQIIARILFNLRRKVVARIIHRENDTFDAQAGICRLAHFANGQHQLRQTFESKELTLKRDKH